MRRSPLFAGELHGYQEEPVDRAVARGRFLIAADMGTGKTAMSIAAAEELLGEGKAKLCVIVCPSALKWQWAQSLAQFTDLPRKKHKLKKQTVIVPASPDCVVIDGKTFQRNGFQYTAADDRKRQWSEIGEATEYVIVSYEDVLADYRYLRRIEPDLVIADECFVAGTPIITPNGPVAIEKLLPGDEVLNAAGTGIVEAVITKHVDRLVTFTLSDGRSFTTTPAHKIFTADGFKVSSEIKIGDYLYGQPEALRVVRGRTACDNQGREEADLCQTKHESVLRSILLSEMADVAAVLEERVHAGAGGENQCQPAEIPGRTSRTLEGERSSYRGAATGYTTGSSGEDLRCAQTERTQTSYSRRKWPWLDSSADNSLGDTGSRMGTGVRGDDRGRIPAAALQDRFGESTGDGGRRSGRDVTQFTDSKSAGSPEGSVADGAWVVGVQVHEPGDTEFTRFSGGEDFVKVYDLQVSGHPSYSAAGILVHNCTAIKSFKAQRSKKLKKYLNAPYRIGLTGTPLENGKPEELFSIMQWVDADVLGRWDLFDATYIVRDDRGIVLGYQNIDILLEKMAPVMHRLTKEQPEVARHMPDAEIDTWYVDIGKDAQEVYERMGMDLYDRIKQQSKFGGGFDVAAYYAGHSDEKSAVGKIMVVHQSMEMLLCHPDLVIMSGMDYLETKGLPANRQKGSKYAYDLWQSGALDEVTGSPKLERLRERLDELVASGSKVLVYTKYRGMLEILAEEIGHASVQFHGAMTPHDKASALAQFKSKNGPPVFLSSHAGSHGVDLPVADHLINYDPAWSSGKADQINARHVRASSKFEKVYVHNLVTSGTIEARMLDVQSGKRETARAFLGDRKGIREMEMQTQSLTSFLEQTIEGLALLA